MGCLKQNRKIEFNIFVNVMLVGLFQYYCFINDFEVGVTLFVRQCIDLLI